MPPKVICVVGPTASGKTKMGVALAKTFDGEVVSVDSMQIYRGMAIGTAAPTPEETEGIPHHMCSSADFPACNLRTIQIRRKCGRRRTHCADCPFLNEYKQSKKSKCEH